MRDRPSLKQSAARHYIGIDAEDAILLLRGVCAKKHKDWILYISYILPTGCLSPFHDYVFE